MATPDLPNEVVSAILSKAEMPIDTYLDLKRDIPIDRATKVQVKAKVKAKLDMMFARRTIALETRKNNDYNRWCNLEELVVRIPTSRSKHVELIVEDVDGQIRMSFKILRVDHVMQEIHTLRRQFCDVNTGLECEGFIESDYDDEDF